MRLEFSVLWFDDDVDYFDSLDLDQLNGEIRSWGFLPKIRFVSTPEEFMQASPFSTIDLIVVDRNLEGYPDGQEFISNIRANAIYTETIFYSAGNSSNLWDAIREKELEGVFVSSRAEVESKILRVGRQSIRKILDLENMRGIVMAEVGELDLMLDEIIEIGMSQLSEDKRKTIFDRFTQNVSDQLRNNEQSLIAFSENPQIDIMLSLCDSDKRWQNLNRLSRIDDRVKKMKTLNRYVEDVLKPRNFLAHGRPEFQKDGDHLFRYGNREYLFSEETSMNLRKTILEYKSEFRRIIDAIKT